MPRMSPYAVLLTDEEMHRLQRTASEYTSPYCDVVRAKVILLAAQGLGNKQIGLRLDLPRQIVSKWRKRFCLERLAGLESRPRAGAGPGLFPPELEVEIKALACELPSESGLPFSRFSCADIAHQAVRRGLAASISGTTVWRWLEADAIKPWNYRSWIFPRDPQFALKAGRVLDLYQGVWEGQMLGSDEYIISADEKTGLQARHRIAPTQPPQPGKAGRVEFEYERRGVLAYMAAWDVRRAKVFGLCEQTTGIESYHHLVDLVMSQEPYRSAKRVFWIADNGSSHCGEKSKQRLVQWYPNAVQVHLPVHASWLNQIEIYFSIVSRKVLTPDDFADLESVKQKLLAFQAYYETLAKPFEWKFTRANLNDLLEKLKPYYERSAKTAA